MRHVKSFRKRPLLKGSASAAIETPQEAAPKGTNKALIILLIVLFPPLIIAFRKKLFS